jgi:DNA-binding SARP family transcriptional activator/tetratricopeptide (TPR) repeat protein
MPLEITLLGEVTARVDGQEVDLGPPRQRCVLAALAVDAGRLVPAERLMGRVWGVDTPARGRATLHSHVSRLRGALRGAEAIVRRSDGYTLEVGADRAVDLLAFRALCEQARNAGEDTCKVTLLTEALALWRGEPLTGLSGEWVEAERAHWEQKRWTAEHDLVNAQLRLGRGEELVATLSARTTRHPLDERVAGQYMLALHHAGRLADALDHYQQFRKRLAEELGSDPSAALQGMHQRILVADPHLVTKPTSTTTPVTVPRQVPAAPAPFVGRRDELARLDSSLSTPTADGGTVLISAIGGAGGVGKTWLALHWVHRHFDRFPDGQLFVDLHGFSPAARPAHPADVLGGFLEALGVDRDRQPSTPERRTELYRSLVADKRMLVVLDNAATTDQITPLLPGGPHCTVVITSRNYLRGLVARHGARPVHLDVLTDHEARTLLSATLSADRTATDERAIAELVDLCGGFPLALGLIAARAAAEPHLPLTDIVAELRLLGLHALDSDDPIASLPAVLSWSLRHLTDQQRQVFALLGIAPGPDIGRPAASYLTGLSVHDTYAVLRELTDASLVDRVADGRYAMHDLVRAYATTVAGDLPDDVRENALRRILDFHTHTAHAAERLLNPRREPPHLDPPSPGVRVHPLADATTALAWFDTEHACLLAAHHTATALAWHPVVWHLAWALDTYHYRRGHRHDQLTTWLAAADAATHLPDPDTRTLARLFLGYAHAELGRHEDAVEQLNLAITLAEERGHVTHQAQAHRALARTWELKGDDQRALEYADRALDLYRGLDQPAWEANALNSVGWFAARLGDYDTAREHCQAALALHRRHPNPDGEAATLDSLGYIDHHSGNHTGAITHYRDALTLFRELGITYEVAYTLDALGRPHVALGQKDQARTVWREALQLYREQGRPDEVARVQRQLDDLD